MLKYGITDHIRNAFRSSTVNKFGLKILTLCINSYNLGITTNLFSMRHQIEIIEKKPFGLVIKHISTNIIQMISEYEFQKRIDWGIYEVVNHYSDSKPKNA